MQPGTGRGAAFLGALAAALWAVVALQARTGIHPLLLATAAGVTLCLAAWPFAHGWRPGRPAFVACPACKTLMRRHELPNGLCPACMGPARSA